MPNGKDYLLFYLKLLCESVDHEGNLRFSEEIPYNEQMLATITHTNVDIVRSAIKMFTGLHMMDILDDGTYHMKEVQKLIGSETYWAQKKRESRERQLEVGHFPTLSNACPTCPVKSKELEKELELELDKDNNTTTHAKPTNLEVAEYFGMLLDEDKAGVEAYRWYQYNEQRKWGCLPNWKTAAERWIEKI